MTTTDRQLIRIAEIVLGTAAKLSSSQVEHLKFPQFLLLVNQVVN
jgi:hypothetical protein